MDNVFEAFVEGDQICVTNAQGVSDKGVFLRIENDFLIWVKGNQGDAVYAITSLEGITVYKV